MEYAKEGHTSTLLYPNSKLGYDGGISVYSSAEYNVTAKSKKLYTLVKSGEYIYKKIPHTDYTSTGEKYTWYEIIWKPKYTIKELPNLGLYRREQPDMAITKDLSKVKVEINEKDLVYNYNQRRLHKDEDANGYDLGVKFGERYGNMKYTRPIYEADAKFISEDKNRELSLYTTYEISILNNSTNLGTKINNLVDYYDSRYELVGVGRTCGEDGSISDAIEFSNQGTVGKYKKATINTSGIGTIANQTETVIYARFKLNRETVEHIIMNEDEELENIVEIESYTVYSNSSGSNLYGGVDVNSNPGSSTPGNMETYEDDTDAAPGLLLVPGYERTMEGLVFEDNPLKEKLKSNIREGNGEYDSGENTIENVKVELLRKELVNGVDTWVVAKKLNSEELQVFNTAADGKYKFENFAAGDYIVRYTWADKNSEKYEYMVQNYKGTIFDESAHANAEWYKTNSPRKSDARDYYDDADKINDDPAYTRKQIDAEYATIQYDTLGKAKDSDMKVTSVTPAMSITVEYDEPESRKPTSGTKYVYPIENVDFGIIERPRQHLLLTKRMSHAKITLANGQVILDADIDEKGNLKGQIEKFVYFGPHKYGVYGTNEDGTNNYRNPFVEEPFTNVGPLMITGQGKYETDVEILQGSTLEINYTITIENTSEEDYDDKNFYHQGTKVLTASTPKVRMSPSKIIDYLSDNWSFDKTNNEKWEVITVEDLESGTEIKVADTVFQEGTEIDKRKIVYTKALETAKLAAKQATDINVKTIRTLSSEMLNSEQGCAWDNEAEITEITKNGGGIVKISIPGNYVPGSGKRVEPDGDMAETFTIVPSTGGNLNYTIVIITIVTALGVIGLGAFIIKKKVLDE